MNLLGKLRAYCAIGSLSLAALTQHAFAQDTPAFSDILAELQGPITVLLDNGNRQTGRVSSWDGTNLQLEVSIGGGVAEISFLKDDIRDLGFPGNEYKQLLYEWMQSDATVEQAMNLFRAYYQQRGPYLSILNPREISLFVEYAEFALAQDRPLKAVAMIDVISPYIEDERVLDQLEESLLLAFFKGGMREEAEAKAREWIKEAPPSGNSALGWRLLAELHFENEEFETAFWTALHPVAFSNQMPMNHLDACYAFAILAAEELRLKGEPERLAAEMRKRNLAWPEYIEILQGKAPAAFLAEAEEPEEAEAAPAIELLEEPIQTPSPVDPIESLPTRIYN